MIRRSGGISPATESARRNSEKAQIHDIKERFSGYIHNVRSMRNQLRQGDHYSAVQHLQEELLTLRNTYEKEIAELRAKLEGSRDGLSSRQSSVMVTEYQSRLLEMNSDILKKDEEIRALQLLVAQKESDIQSLRGAAIAPSIQLDLARQEGRELQQSILMAQTKYEEEFCQRSALQDQLRELTHHIEDLNLIHAKEMQELRAQVEQSEALVLQLEDKLRSISRGNPTLMETVQRIQEASEAEVKRLQNETESTYTHNLLELQMRLNNDQILLGQAQEENQTLHRRGEELTTEITTLEKKLFSEETNNRTLMEKLETEQVRSLQHIRALEARLEELQDLLLAKMKELNTFQETSVSLRSELDALKSMLDEEEHLMSSSHLHYSHTSSSSSNPLTASFPSPSHTLLPEHTKTSEILPPTTTSHSTEPSTAASSEGTYLTEQHTALPEENIGQTDECKRSASAPRFTAHIPDHKEGQGSFYHSSQTSSENDMKTALTSAIGDLEISEVGPSGNYVRIFNRSLDKEGDLGRCLLQQNILGHPVSVYRFPPKTRVMGRCTVTVWASSAGKTQNPPTDFLWKEQNTFVTEPRCTTILCSPNGQALAWFTPVRGKMRKSLEKPVSVTEIKAVSPVQSLEPEKQEEEPITEGRIPSPQFPPAHHRPATVSALLKREKIPPVVLPPTSSPWTHSPASPTHPDFMPSRLMPLGSEGNSSCRQTRSQTARTEPSSGASSAGSKPSRDPVISPVSKKSRGPTRSAGPNSRGVLYLGYSAPAGSVLQKFFSNASYNIRLASHVSLSPTMLSSY
ncbi:lamin tail domain-containing protein 1 isoform X2 [Hyperolius riggenbachi]|uniref:lamin tail domain-containing protein 1 isoform X2 n=1 Tax=Hyperolius riggenbachi TaxID=752182 RepID=UPI0035A2EA9F